MNHENTYINPFFSCLGGLHVNVGVTGQRFVGCIESVHINNHVVDFKHETAEQEFVEFGCRAPVRPQQSYAGLNFFRVRL